MLSPRLGLLRMRGFGAGVCSVGCRPKAAESVVWIGLEIHAKEEENYMQEVISCQHLQHAWITGILLVSATNYRAGNTKTTHLLVRLHKTTK